MGARCIALHSITKRNANGDEIVAVNNKLNIILIRPKRLWLVEAEVADLSREGNTGCL
jgi:hypothetical protein